MNNLTEISCRGAHKGHGIHTLARCDLHGFSRGAPNIYACQLRSPCVIYGLFHDVPLLLENIVRTALVAMLRTATWQRRKSLITTISSNPWRVTSAEDLKLRRWRSTLQAAFHLPVHYTQYYALEGSWKFARTMYVLRWKAAWRLEQRRRSTTCRDAKRKLHVNLSNIFHRVLRRMTDWQTVISVLEVV